MECSARTKGCDSCDLMGTEYGKQLKDKQEYLRSLLSGYKKVEEVIPCDEPFYYRCKIINTFAKNKRGETYAGLYARHSHKVVDTRACILEDKLAQKAATAVLAAVKKCGYEPFNEDLGRGLIRHMVIRRAFFTDQVMALIVTSGDILPQSKKFISFVREYCPEITTVVQNINARHSSAVLGYKNKTLYGRGYIEDKLCGCRFKISPTSFYQINPAQTEKLYNCAIALASLTEGQSALDAYCGTGTIGICAAKLTKAKITGVELNNAAVKDAVHNAELNEVNNIRFCCSDAGAFMKKMAERNENVDVVFMDPPREGLGEVFLKELCALKPPKVVYISCGPESLARDIKFMTARSYRVERIIPFDMFPQTSHVETVVLMTRKAAKA